MKYEFIKITQNQSVFTLALNRPDKRNAFHAEMIREIIDALKKLKKEKNIRALVLTGEGKTFCAGGDLEWMRSMADYTYKQNLKDAEQLFEMFWGIRNFPVPVICRAFGHCFGGGAGLVAACDIAAVEKSTQFCFSEVKWGLVPSVISPFVIDRVSPSYVREWFLTARVFDGQEAKSGGLVQFAGEMNDVDAYIERTISQILAAAPEAVRETKKLYHSLSHIKWKSVESQVTQLIAKRRVSDEGQKGLKAFLEKRTPNWSEPPYGAPAKD